jgi:ABC-2 type transport system permease protein
MLKNIWYLFIKDLVEYYSKAPVISWGILFTITAIALMSLGLGLYGESRLVPGMFTLSLLFASTSMAQVCISFEKMNNSFQRILFLPIRSYELLIGKSLGGILYGFIGVGIAGFLTYIITGHTVLIRPWYFIVGVVLGSIIFSLLSIVIMLLFDPIPGIAVLNIIRFTMVFLGGIVFPKIFMPKLLLPLVYSMPSVYIVEIIRFGLYNTWDYVDPYTSNIISLIILITLLLSSKMLIDHILYP